MNKLVIFALIVFLGFSLKSHHKARNIRKAHNMQEAHNIQEVQLFDAVACRKQNGTVCGFFTMDCCVKGCVTSVFSGETCQDEKFIIIPETPKSSKTADNSTTGTSKTNSTLNPSTDAASVKLAEDKEREYEAAFNQYINESRAYVFSNPQISMGIFAGKPVSSSAIESFKSFVKDNESFNTYRLAIFDKKGAPQCMRKLTDDQRRKLLAIGMDSSEFTDFFNDKSSGAYKQLTKKISEAIENDSSLGKDVALCYTQNSHQFDILY